MKYGDNKNVPRGIGPAEVSFDSDFIVISMKCAAQKNGGHNLKEIVEVLDIANDIRKLLKEIEQNSMKLYEKMRNEGKISKEVFTILAMMVAKNVPPEEFAKAIETISYDELNKFQELNLEAEVKGTELERTFRKAIPLRHRTEEALTSIIPEIERKYPEKRKTTEEFKKFFTRIKQHLDTICPEE